MFSQSEIQAVSRFAPHLRQNTASGMKTFPWLPAAPLKLGQSLVAWYLTVITWPWSTQLHEATIWGWFIEQISGDIDWGWSILGLPHQLATRMIYIYIYNLHNHHDYRYQNHHCLIGKFGNPAVFTKGGVLVATTKGWKSHRRNGSFWHNYSIPEPWKL